MYLCIRGLAQAVRLRAPAMLWQRTLRCSPAPSKANDSSADSGTGAHNGLVLALSTALADLLQIRGGDELSAAALRILFDPRLAAWYGATAAEASRQPRVVAAAQRLLMCLMVCPCYSLGVSARAARPSRALRAQSSRAHVCLLVGNRHPSRPPRAARLAFAVLPGRRRRGGTGACRCAQ